MPLLAKESLANTTRCNMSTRGTAYIARQSFQKPRRHTCPKTTPPQLIKEGIPEKLPEVEE